MVEDQPQEGASTPTVPAEAQPSGPGPTGQERPFLTKAGLKQRGWTDLSIKKFLGEPDRKKPNPYYKQAADMCLYAPGNLTTMA